jgi:SAM-dependent methyltransferase
MPDMAPEIPGLATACVDSHFVRRTHCPICGSLKYRTLYASRYTDDPIRSYLESFYSEQGQVEFEYLQGAEYSLCECAQCDGIFQEHIPDDMLMERLYEHWIDPERMRSGFGSDFASACDYAQEIMQIIAFLDRKPSSLAFLDFGMGWGQWAMMARAFGCNCIGTELSESRIAFAASNGVQAVGWHELGERSFDFINTEQVFEHLPNPLETLRHFKRLLAPGGIVKISVPDANDISRRLRIMDWSAPKQSRNSLNAVAPLEHINCFRRRSISVMAAEAGMREVAIPMRLQYAYETGWYGRRRFLRNLVRPVYRNVLKNRNAVFLTASDGRGSLS